MACNACKRRKERCSGDRPCTRCRIRNVPETCRYDHQAFTTRQCIDHRVSKVARKRSNRILEDRVLVEELHLPTLSPPSLAKSYSPYIITPTGQVVYSGTSSSLVILHCIRELVRHRIGKCSFTENDALPIGDSRLPGSWTSSERTAHRFLDIRPTVEEARHYYHWYLVSTSTFLGLFTEHRFFSALETWLFEAATHDLQSALYYLILAIGAQTCPGGSDDVASTLFFEAYQMMQADREDVNLFLLAQVHILRTMYLIGQSQMQSAYLELGKAIRLTHSLGLHELNEPESSTSTISAEQSLWDAIHILDVFLGLWLGRPLSTQSSLESASRFSMKDSLCDLWTSILNEQNRSPVLKPDALDHIGQRHRALASRFAERIPSDYGSTCTDTASKVGLCHLVQAFYGAVAVPTEPFLFGLAERSALPGEVAQGEMDLTSSSESPSERLLANSCVDAAVRGIEAGVALVQDKDCPRRIPWLMQNIFRFALVIATAILGHLEFVPVFERTFEDARMIIQSFAPLDQFATQYSEVLLELHSAIDAWRQRRSESTIEIRRKLIQDIFGSVEEEPGTDLGSELVSTTSNLDLQNPGFDVQGTSITWGLDFSLLDGNTCDTSGNCSNDFLGLSSSATHPGSIPYSGLGHDPTTSMPCLVT
jgi:hypothetical protein